MTEIPWLSVIGIGENGLGGLSPAARTLIETAEILVGGGRHLAHVPETGAERLPWGASLAATLDEVGARRGRRVAVLSSGDPLHYGIGCELRKRFSPREMTIIPAPSSFSLACARLLWPRDEVETLTLHGRPISLLDYHLRPGARLLILSRDGKTPAEVAARLSERCFGRSPVTVFERMGGAHERRREDIAESWNIQCCDDLNTIAVECIANDGAQLLPRVPGLPDDAFIHDGQITKRAVRAATLAALRPMPGFLLWDVGAGSGSIAIEWLRAERNARAIAIERNPARLAHIAQNAERLGVPDLEIVSGEAPAALSGLETPDAVFLGGGASRPGLLEACFEALRRGGRLVANAVSVEGETRIFEFSGKRGGELTRIAVSTAEPAGGFRQWKAKHPVTQISVEKPR